MDFLMKKSINMGLLMKMKKSINMGLLMEFFINMGLLMELEAAQAAPRSAEQAKKEAAY